MGSVNVCVRSTKRKETGGLGRARLRAETDLRYAVLVVFAFFALAATFLRLL